MSESTGCLYFHFSNNARLSLQNNCSSCGRPVWPGSCVTILTTLLWCSHWHSFRPPSCKYVTQLQNIWRILQSSKEDAQISHSMTGFLVLYWKLKLIYPGN